jgi:hypothetical protein
VAAPFVISSDVERSIVAAPGSAGSCNATTAPRGEQQLRDNRHYLAPPAISTVPGRPTCLEPGGDDGDG